MASGLPCPPLPSGHLQYPTSPPCGRQPWVFPFASLGHGWTCTSSLPCCSCDTVVGLMVIQGDVVGLGRHCACVP